MWVDGRGGGGSIGQIDRRNTLGLALTVLTVLAVIQTGHIEIGLIALTLMFWSLGSMSRATRRAGSGMVPLPAPARST